MGQSRSNLLPIVEKCIGALLFATCLNAYASKHAQVSTHIPISLRLLSFHCVKRSCFDKMDANSVLHKVSCCD